MIHRLLCVVLGAVGHVSAQSRIVNGMDAVPHQWPWQATLQVQAASQWQHTCGGSLVRQQWVMTAAHCIRKGPVYRIVLGKHDLRLNERGEFASNIATSVVHPSWNDDPRRGFDIALMKLSSAVPLSEWIQVVTLPPAQQELLDNATCVATGWGLLAGGWQMPDVLQEATLPLVNRSTCGRPEWWNTTVNENLICAGDNRSVCSGDSGGPLSCQDPNGSWVVYGITSFGHARCNTFQKPAMFTRVSVYTDWVSQVTTGSSGSSVTPCVSVHLMSLLMLLAVASSLAHLCSSN